MSNNKNGSGYSIDNYYMEKFFTPNNKNRFVKWLLQMAIDNSWAIVFEYTADSAYGFFKDISTETKLPKSSRHEYSIDCRLIAILNSACTDKIVECMLALTHVLSIHSNDKMIFLIADDFHEECFSSSVDFHDTYYDTIKRNGLIDLS